MAINVLNQQGKEVYNQLFFTGDIALNCIKFISR